MPCRMIAPILEEIDKTHGDKLQIAKLNVDENPRTASEYGKNPVYVWPWECIKARWPEAASKVEGGKEVA